MKYAIYKPNGKIDRDPEPMIFNTYSEALEALNTGIFPRGYYVDAYVTVRKKKTPKTNAFGLDLNLR